MKPCDSACMIMEVVVCHLGKEGVISSIVVPVGFAKIVDPSEGNPVLFREYMVNLYPYIIFTVFANAVEGSSSIIIYSVTINV